MTYCAIPQASPSAGGTAPTPPRSPVFRGQNVKGETAGLEARSAIPIPMSWGNGVLGDLFPLSSLTSPILSLSLSLSSVSFFFILQSHTLSRKDSFLIGKSITREATESTNTELTHPKLGSVVVYLTNVISTRAQVAYSYPAINSLPPPKTSNMAAPSSKTLKDLSGSWVMVRIFIL